MSEQVLTSNQATPPIRPRDPRGRKSTRTAEEAIAHQRDYYRDRYRKRQTKTKNVCAHVKRGGVKCTNTTYKLYCWDHIRYHKEDVTTSPSN